MTPQKYKVLKGEHEYTIDYSGQIWNYVWKTLKFLRSTNYKENIFLPKSWRIKIQEHKTSVSKQKLCGILVNKSNCQFVQKCNLQKVGNRIWSIFLISDQCLQFNNIVIAILSLFAHV